MQKGDHIGKIIITLPENVNDLPTERNSDLLLRPDFSYLLIGGLGGLGRVVSTWMVERGAKHLIYLSRSAGNSNDDKDFMHELQIQGCTTQAFAGDVADPTVVRNVVKLAGRLIIGVIQMSMILKVILPPSLRLASLLNFSGSKFPTDDIQRLAVGHRA